MLSLLGLLVLPQLASATVDYEDLQAKWGTDVRAARASLLIDVLQDSHTPSPKSGASQASVPLLTSLMSAA